MEANAYESVAIVEKEEGTRLIFRWQERCFCSDIKCKGLGGSDYSYSSVTMFSKMWDQKLTLKIVCIFMRNMDHTLTI